MTPNAAPAGEAGTSPPSQPEIVQTMREELRVEERELAERPVADLVDVPFQAATIRIPVRGEEVVVQRRIVVAGEVVVAKQRQELDA